ncbi:MAG: hypothetical protein QM820_32930 [Minicystis sp.]
MACFSVALAAFAAALASTGCNVHAIERLAMASAFRPDPAWRAHVKKPLAGDRYALLAGDMHCHVSPPDGDYDVTRSPAETVALAREEGLDFVILTPHLPGRFYLDPDLRDRASAAHAAMRAAFAEARDTIFVPGFEYTDYHYGHVSASFADLGRVLAAVPVDVARAHPERFFEAWVADGGVLVVNHPLVTPLQSRFAAARADMSFRPWTSTAPVPPEITAVARLAAGYEAYNAAVSHMRDGFLLDDADLGLRGVLGRLDQEIAAAGRRIAPVGGSDSHTGYLRATTFVLAEARTEAAVREAILAGRVCVRSPEACSLEARAPGGSWVTVGGSVRGGPAIEVRASGGSIVIHRDGKPVALPGSGEIARVDVPADRCALLRARVGEGWSAPIYVNCTFAEPR